jgi:subtilisin family serine protease
MSAALEAARSAGLLATYAPTLAYHKQEPYWASSPGVMTDCYVESRYSNYLQTSGGEIIAQAGPSLAHRRLTLAVLDGRAYAGDHAAKPKATDYLNAHGGTYVEDAARMQADPLYGDRVYGRYVEADAGRVWLQYWLFYYYNDKSLAGIGLHEGDWEMIQIGLGDDGMPAVATYAQHTGGERREHWDDVRREHGGQSPLVYVGLGSHASYFDPGEYRIKFFPMLDHARGNGRRAKPQLAELAGSEPWLAWPGRWGRAGFSDTGSPRGPMQHRQQWFRPDEFHKAARDRRRRLGPIYFAARPEARVPAPALVAVRDGEHVAISYDFRAARKAPERPSRLLLSVESADPRQAPATHSFVVAKERDRIVHPARIGPGEYVVHATALTAEDAAGETVTVEVADRPTGPRPDREGFSLRLLVELPDDWKGGAASLRKAADAALGRDADGRRWRAAHLFPPSPGGRRPPALRRHFQLTGRAIATPAYPPQQQAFDIAHRLRDATGADVQPDLPSSAFAPPSGPGDPDERVRATGRRVRPVADTAKDWSLTAIHCQEAWKCEPTQGAGISVGHPDTGYTDHPELEAEALDLTRAWNVIDDDSDARDPLPRRVWWRPLDSPGHGTATASVIAGRAGGAITGAAPGATLVPLRTVKSVVQVFDGDVGIAIERARQAGCDIVSMSLGGVGFAGAVRDAIRTAVDSGMIVMAAAGNDVGFVTAPASWPECLAIGATGITDDPWSGSSRGEQVDFCAPGEGVWAATARRDGDGEEFTVEAHNGTSFAVAHTAGVAALWLAHHGAEKLRRRYGKKNLQRVFLSVARTSVTKPKAWDRHRYGTGILNARALLDAKLPAPATFDRVPARRAGSQAAPDVLDRLATLWPDLTKVEVRSRLAAALGKRGGDLDATLDRFGGELFYQYSQDPELRRSLERPRGPRAAAAAAGGRPDRLRSTASRALTEALGPSP